jgi:concentrative nucleoside transporter, CNT family
MFSVLLPPIARIVLGFIANIGFCFSLSLYKKNIPWGKIILCLVGQGVLFILLDNVPVITNFINSCSHVVVRLGDSAQKGTAFVFDFLADATKSPFAALGGGNSQYFIFAFRVMPIIILYSTIFSILFYWGILQKLIQGLSFIVCKVFGIGDVAGFFVVSNIVISYSDALLCIKKFVGVLKPQEIMLITVRGMSSVSASVFLLYGFLLSKISEPVVTIKYIIISLIMNIPAAIAVSWILHPSIETPTFIGKVTPDKEPSLLAAIDKGMTTGGVIVCRIILCLIGYIALLDVVNLIVEHILPHYNGQAIGLEQIFSVVFYPVSWLLGIPLQDVSHGASLLFYKNIFNESVAFGQMSQWSWQAASIPVLIVCLASFSNFSTMGVLSSMFKGEFAPNIPAKQVESILIRGILGGVSVGIFAALWVSLFIQLGIIK